MALTKKAAQDKIDALFTEDFCEYEVESVPTIDMAKLTHGATGMSGEFTFLYVDMRRSSDLASSHRRQTVARIFKAFHFSMVEIIKDKGGSVRSFDGDRVMAVFAGKSKVNDAIDAAMLMEGAKEDVLGPKIKARYQEEAFDIGIGIATGAALCVKAGVGYDANNRDLVWLGHPPNLGAKLSDAAGSPNNIYACATTFGRLQERNRWTTKDGVKQDMWTAGTITFAGSAIAVHRCGWYRHLPT